MRNLSQIGINIFKWSVLKSGFHFDVQTMLNTKKKENAEFQKIKCFNLNFVCFLELKFAQFRNFESFQNFDNAETQKISSVSFWKNN